MPSRILVVAVLLTACLWPARAAAWGNEGHRIVGAIAERYLTPEARATVDALLAGDLYADLADATTWADAVRGHPDFVKSKPLHYINVKPGAKSAVFERDCPEQGCVVSGIRDYRVKLGDAGLSAADRAEALKFIAHFVGDIHQPLHAGHRSDRGGNDIFVRFFGVKENLHRIWDASVLERAAIPWPVHAARLARAITPDEEARWAAELDPLVWAGESYRLAARHAYRKLRRNRVDEPVYKAWKLVIEKQLQKAGVRLAALLNATLKGEAARITGQQAPATLRIVAANLGRGEAWDGGAPERLLQALQPDLVLAQDFRMSSSSSKVLKAFMARFSDAPEPWQAFTERGQGHPVAILSRWPIVDGNEWPDPLVEDRDFVWARIALPGDQELWAVSVFLSEVSPLVRRHQVEGLLDHIRRYVPPGAWLVIGGSLQAARFDEPAMDLLRQVAVPGGWPTDSQGRIETDAGRRRWQDAILLSPALAARQQPVELAGQRFPNGLVFDGRSFPNMTGLAPLRPEDSAAGHMLVVKELRLR